MHKEFHSLADMMKAIPDEEAAVAYFTAMRWKNGPFCPFCGSTKVYHFADKRDHKCGDCKGRFSIKVGTVMEGTKIPVRKWLVAMWLISVHKKGIASTTLARDLGVQQKTAWFMLHRLRHAARTRSFNRPLKGTIEVDESFVGGRDRNMPAHKRGTKKKAILIGLLERGGELRARQVDSVSEAADMVEDHVAHGSKLMTDEAPSVKRAGRFYEHEYVTHSKGEYGRGPVHINSLEGYWSLLKRQIYGIHHWVSAKHLAKYTDESVWRYNRRDVKDGERLNELIARLDGRITYKVLTA